MKEYRLLIVIAAFFLVTGASPPTTNDRELIVRLQGEVTVLQRQIRDLQEAFDKAQGQSSASMQRLTDGSDTTLRTLSAIEETLKASQTTQINNLTGATSRLAKLSDQVIQNEQRLLQMGQQINQQINSLKEVMENQQKRLEVERKEEQAKTDRLPAINSPDQLYAYAYGQYSKGNYEQAVQHFQRYLEAYAQTEAADNALFWIAESFYAQNKLNDALREYDKLLASFPKGDKASAAQYKKGIILLQFERREEGVMALRLLLSDYPNTPEATLATQELIRLGEPPTPPTKPSVRQRSGRP